MVDLPLRERKRQLRELLDGRVKNGRLSRRASTTAMRCSRSRKEQGLEGVIAKRLDSVYREGRRTRDWLKIKTENNEEFVVAGYTRGSGRRAGTFGALVLAVNEGGELRYVGNVGTGFDDAEIRKLLQAARAAASCVVTVRRRAEDAARAQGRRAMGRAAARRAGALRRVDARRTSPPSGLPRPARRQERRRGAAATSRCPR